MVQLGCQLVKLLLRHVHRHIDKFLVHEPALKNHQQQDAALAHAHKAHMMEPHSVKRRNGGDPDVVGDAAQHFGGRFKHFAQPLPVLHHLF